MEAELFAAERRRPAPDGRALLCAAVYAREIQGITATHKLKNARNRAPVPPFRREAPLSVSKEGKGSQEGTGNHWCPVPFCLRRQTAASSQNPATGSGSAQIPRVFFNFPCLQLTFSIFHGILNYRKQKEPMPASISSLINGIRHLVFHHQRAVRSHSPETNNAPNGAYRLLV